MRRKITLVSTDAGPGHNCGLAIGLKKYGNVTVVWENKNLHKLDYLVPDARYGYRNIPNKGDNIIIVGCLAFDRMKFNAHLFARVRSGYDRIHVIITDGKFARNPDYYNKMFGNYNVLAHGCKIHFRGKLPTRTFYQPFDLSHVSQAKSEFTISHSPFGKKKFREKGTLEIIEATKGYDFDLITGVSWDECLIRKAKSHIFVDQIDHYDRSKFKFRDKQYVWPALGKSGLEALHLGCLVITHGKGYDTDIPAPPVAWCNGNFKEVLEYYIKNENERTEMANEGKKWALQYASYDFAARNVLR